MNMTSFESATNDAPKDLSSVEQVLDRLESLISEENELLKSNNSYDHSSYILRKNHLLREMMILQRLDLKKLLPPSIQPRMADIKALVQQNHQLLKTQVEAMNSITSLLTNTALMESADGTYSKNARAV